MFRHLNNFGIAAFALMTAVTVLGPQRAAAAQKMAVDTIVLDQEIPTQDVPVDMKWKTRKEGGKWVETLKVAEGVDSLLLVINDEEQQEVAVKASGSGDGTKVRKREMECNSRILLYMKNSAGEWEEIFGTTCALSSGLSLNMEDLFGVYRADRTFGTLENPGSLLPYKHLTEKDYWVMDDGSEDYGQIVTVGPKGMQTDLAINLEGMKAYSNYGLVLKPEDADEKYPALIVNCQQADAVENTVSGIQVSQPYVRQMIQLLDSDTRIVIARNLDDLEADD